MKKILEVIENPSRILREGKVKYIIEKDDENHYYDIIEYKNIFYAYANGVLYYVGNRKDLDNFINS